MSLNRKIFMFLLGWVFLFSPALAGAQELETTDPGASSFQGFVKAKVVSVDEDTKENVYGQNTIKQKLKVKVLDGVNKDKEVVVEYRDFQSFFDRTIKVGDKIVLAEVKNLDENSYEVVDRYRLPALYAILVLFVVVTLFALRGKGLTALVALGVSIVIILKFLVPQILNGQSPLLATLVASFGIAIVSFFVGHGVSKRIGIAFVSTLISVIVGMVLAYVFAGFVKLFGLATEETQFVQNFFQGTINLRGLLLAGIVIAMLGILDDVTTAQAGAVEELKLANPNLDFKELFKRGFRVGQEHMIGLVNTLFLAYAGVALPIFLLFTVNTQQPLWVLLNSEYVTEEIVRTMVGSITLILAVPLTTVIASWYFTKKQAGSNSVQTLVAEEVIVIAEIPKEEQG